MEKQKKSNNFVKNKKNSLFDETLNIRDKVEVTKKKHKKRSNSSIEESALNNSQINERENIGKYEDQLHYFVSNYDGKLIFFNA